MYKSIEQNNKIPSSSNSKCSTITFAYKWTIDNFNRLYDDEAYNWKWEISSAKFSPSKNEEFEFLLQLYPKTQQIETYKEYASFGVGVCDMPQKYNGKISCRWIVSIDDENGDKCRSKESSNHYLYYSEQQVHYGYMKYTELLNYASQNLPMNQLTLNIEIHLKADDRIFNVITDNEVGTSRFDCANKVTRAVHIWTIENFPQLFNPNGVKPHFIQSDKFPALEEQNVQFRLNLHPNGQSGSDKDKIDIVIRHNSSKNALVHYRLSILDVDDEECNTAGLTGRIYAKVGKCHGYNRAYLLDNSNGLVNDNKLRIHCEMSYMVDSIEHNKICNKPQMLNCVHKSESITDVAKKIFNFVSHQWTIDKFSELCANSKEEDCIDSPIFQPPTDTRYVFRLRLWPRGLDEDKNKSISFDLYNSSSDFKQVTGQLRLSLLDVDGVKWTKWDRQFTISNSQVLRNSDFLSLSRLQSQPFIKQFLPNDKLTFICEICAIEDKKKLYEPLTKPTDKLTQPSVHVSNSIINYQGSVKMNDFTVNSSPNDGTINELMK